jgi:hypothetical protein
VKTNATRKAEFIIIVSDVLDPVSSSIS